MVDLLTSLVSQPNFIIFINVSLSTFAGAFAREFRDRENSRRKKKTLVKFFSNFLLSWITCIGAILVLIYVLNITNFLLIIGISILISVQGTDSVLSFSKRVLKLILSDKMN